MITILISVGKMRTVLVTVSLGALLLAGCGGSDTVGDDQIDVVVTTSIWGDIVSNVVRDDATVEVLIPRGADAHDFEPTSQQVADLQRADIVITNGLGLEQGLADTLEGAIADGANVYAIAPDLDPLPFDDDGGHDLDPHVWLDPVRVATAAGLIAERLHALDSTIDWEERATAYADELEALDEEITRILSVIPDADRKLVTNHEAFGYFAERYSFAVIGVVIPGGSTLADPSSAELAALVADIQREGVRAIFAETTRPNRLAEAVAAEVGGDIEVVELYTESLGDSGSEAGTLTGMLLANARLIADALAS